VAGDPREAARLMKLAMAHSVEISHRASALAAAAKSSD
jgi:hypothetical protein